MSVALSISPGYRNPIGPLPRREIIVGTVLKIVGIIAVGALALLGILAIFGGSPLGALESGAASEGLPVADEAPLAYAYLDSERTEAYLGQALNGLPTSEQHTEELTRSVNASLGAAESAQLAGSQEAQESTVTTITPKAVDRFYTFVRLLRKRGEADPAKSDSCRDRRLQSNDDSERPFWLGEINDQGSQGDILRRIQCIGVGNFVRIHNAQLFIPSFAQALPRVQSANAFFGALPAKRTPFTSPVQSAGSRNALHRYAKLIGNNSRIPVIAAPFGSLNRIGQGVTFFLPTRYRGITSEPSLLSGSVTVVGKIIYLGEGRQPYIDYPSVFTFGRALRGARGILLRDLGVCSAKPPRAAKPVEKIQKAPRKSRSAHRRQGKRAAKRMGGCRTTQAAFRSVRKAVSFRPPVVVVLPLAIYE